ncbi:hypothetical protein [Thermoactinomyces sp. DSM 45892]|uniref:hypothetical protein n=1 Tax=Thermoactinomyces sp. DSM 45892 TaxID=1882753 RepID=UPI000895281B|nr:hypothetical protein [Thermoactinomyces sp. DSM 45892]SDZ34855.1 hypothetical protein SAMN05444416_1242 [Thermoactinomyces sp. DSM 45892]
MSTELNLEKVVVEIRDWFEENEATWLMLPTGWDGRPYDNIHRLQFLAHRPSKLLLELDQYGLFIFTDLKGFQRTDTKSETVLRFFDFSQCIVVGDTYHKVYKEGSVQFLAPKR